MADNVISEKTPLVTNEPFEISRDVTDNDESEQYTRLHSNQHYLKQISETKVDVEPKKTFSWMNSRTKKILILCIITNVLSSCPISFLGPIYPIEAEKKDMPVAVIGWVFGIFNLFIFILSPIYGKFMPIIGPKFCYVTGYFVVGVCNIMFGTLVKSPNGIPFIAINIACKVVEALGFSAFLTSSLTIVTSEFPENVGFVFGILELGAGAGYIIGPIVGGALYDVGSYGLPFYVFGSLIVVNGCFLWAFLPTINPNVSIEREKPAFYLLRSPLVTLSFCSIVIGTLGMQMFNATFSKLVEPFNLSATIVSVLFSVDSLIYSLMASVWGYITDTKDIQAPLIIGGHLGFGIGFIILGPSPLLPFIPFKLSTVCIGVIFLGFSFGCTLIPPMICMLKGACSLGFEDNMETNAMVSGLFYSAFYIGGFIGPVGGDALISATGYPLTYTVVGLLHLLVMLIQVAYISIRYKTLRKRRTFEDDERTIIAENSIVSKRDTVENSLLSLRLTHRTMSLSTSEPK